MRNPDRKQDISEAENSGQNEEGYRRGEIYSRREESGSRYNTVKTPKIIGVFSPVVSLLFILCV